MMENAILLKSYKKKIKYNKFITQKLYKEYNKFKLQKLLIILNLFISILSLDDIQYITIKLQFNKTGNVYILGNKDALSEPFYPDPDEIHINGINQSEIKSNYYFNDTVNNIKLIWKQAINTTKGLFYDCAFITEIDLSIFDTSQVTDMCEMFYGCSSLISLNLSNFDTSQVTDMYGLFYYCIKLISLDLSNFNTSQVTDMDSMFEGCESLEYINLKMSTLDKVEYTTNIFEEISSNYIICFSDDNFIDLLPGYNQIINCNEILNNYYEFKCYRKDNSNVNIYNNICKKCGLNYYQKEIDLKNNNSYINCYQSTENGYYLDEIDLMYKLCYFTCEKCLIDGNESFHHCIECKHEYKYHLNISNSFNCNYNCTNYHYYDINSNKLYCTLNDECPINYNKLILDKKECLDVCNNDPYYKYEYNNICYSKCPNNTINNSFLCESINNENTQTHYIIHNSSQISTDYNSVLDSDYYQYDSEITQNSINYFNNSESIRNSYNYTDDNELINSDDTINNRYSINKSEIIQKKKIELINNYKNYKNISESKIKEIEFEGEYFGFIELSTTFNEKLNEKENLTSIDLKECENILKNEYKIPYNNSLFIFKVTMKENGMKIPKIEYEVYYPFNNEKLILLNLTLCKGKEIDIFIPVKINDNIDKHNPDSGYYNDICYRASTKMRTDITLSDRQKEFIDNNMTLCEENCKLINYNYEAEKVKCSCEIKIHIPLFDDIKIDKKRLIESFTDVKHIFNFKVMKCFKNVIQKDNIKKNSGFFIFLLICLLFFICLILFYLKFNEFHQNNITKIIEAKKEIFKLKNNKMNEITNNIKNSSTKEHNSKILKKVRKKRKINSMKYLTKDSKLSNSKNYLEKVDSNIINPSKNNEENITNYSEFLELNDAELNSLPYKKALLKDKRSFAQYYISLVKANHLFIFAFFNNNDYNSKIIKIFLFFLFFAFHLTVNALFFTDNTIHTIYKDEGKYNFIYQIPQIIYSSLISGVISFIIKYLSLSEKKILNLKHEKNLELLDQIAVKIFIILKIKFALFFIITFILLSICWYYITCFCGIYFNTQIHFIKDIIISFTLSLIYPFFIYLIPGIFRIFALNAKDKKCIYNFSKVLQII